MWFDSEEEIARKEDLEKMEEKVMFEHTVKTELESPGSTHVPFFSNPEKARVLEKAIKTASDIRSRTRNKSSESIGTWSADEESSGGEREKEGTKGRGGWAWVIVLTVIIFAIASMKDAEEGGRQYIAHYNWSKDQREFFVKEVKIPDGDAGWVSIAIPPYCRMETSRTFDVEYDFGTKETVKEGPNLPRVEVGNFTSTFDVKAVGKGGVLKIWVYKNPKSWDLSQRREELIQETKVLPGGEWVTVTFPCYRVKGGTMWYQITASPHVKVEYDLMDGKPTREDGPGQLVAAGKWPPVIKVRAKKDGGKMELTLNRQFLPD